jgi:hypothetical protein
MSRRTAKCLPLADVPEAPVQRIAELLDRNTVAVGLRLTCRYFRGLFSEYTTVQLDQPVPAWAVAEHFSRPEVVQSLSLRRRRKLLCTVAKAGDVANLRVLASGPGGIGEVGLAGCTLTAEVFTSAAKAGQLQACKLLHELGCPGGVYIVQAAARAGHGEVVDWLVEAGYVCNDKGDMNHVVNGAIEGGDIATIEQTLEYDGGFDSYHLFFAATGGHAAAVRWLLDRHIASPWGEDMPGRALLSSVAYGCDLPFLQVRTCLIRWLVCCSVALQRSKRRCPPF